MDYMKSGGLDKRAIIDKLTSNKNIAEGLSEEKISDIQRRCQALYEADTESCEEWRNEAKKLIEMAKMKDTSRSHTDDWQADIQMPDLIQSAIQFNARTYPEYVKDGKICKFKINGRYTEDKQARAQRVTDHINWQLTQQVPEWADNFDKLLMVLPIVGHVFKVATYDEQLGRNTDTLCMPDQVTINNKPNNPDWSRRISVDYPINHNVCISNQAAGIWRHVELQADDDSYTDDKKYTIVDMYSWYDLDGDGYEEPYTLTFCKNGWELLGIAPRYTMEGLTFLANVDNPEDNKLIGIEPVENVTSYLFFPSPDGQALGFGYGHVVQNIIKGMNACLNQISDAGTLVNMQAGFMDKGLFRDDGIQSFRPGEWKITDINASGSMRDRIFPLPVNPPSAVTFNLYNELKSTSAKLTSTGEIMSGESAPASMPATTVLAIIEQAKVGQNAVLKRINMALGKELKIIYRLNAIYLPDETYFTVGDFEQKQVAKEDYAESDLDIVPVADPMYSTRMERLTRIQAAQQMGVQSPAMVRDALIELGYTAEEADKYMESNISEQAKAAQAQMQMAEQQKEAALAAKDAAEAQIRLMEAESKMLVDKTQAIKNLADAESKVAGYQLDQYNAMADMIMAQQQPQSEANANEQGTPAGLPAMAGEPSNAGGNGELAGGGEDGGQPSMPSGGAGGELGSVPEGEAIQSGSDLGLSGLEEGGMPAGGQE